MGTAGDYTRLAGVDHNRGREYAPDCRRDTRIALPHGREWAIMLYGSARITCLDAQGKPFLDDVKEGDLWFFPTGLPHSIHGLEPDGCEFLLVFDGGTFSEYNTVLLADWTAHTPRSVLAKNFDVPQRALSKIPRGELYIFQAEVPKTPLDEDRRTAAGLSGCRRKTSRSACCRCHPPLKQKLGKCALLIRASSQPRRRLPQRMSSSIPAECANCTGAQT